MDPRGPSLYLFRQNPSPTNLMSPRIRPSAALLWPVALFAAGCAGPLVLEEGFAPLSSSGGDPFVALSVQPVVVVAQCVWWGVLLLWLALHFRDRNRGSTGFARFSIAVYWLVLGACVAVVARDWKRPTRAEYAASLPVAADLALGGLRTEACKQGGTVASPLQVDALAIARECACDVCRVDAAGGCGFTVRGGGRLDVDLRRDARHRLWLFDDGKAQLAFRDGDHACVRPRAGHLADALRPSSWSLVLAALGLMFPWLWGTPTPKMIARDFPGLARAMFLIAWAAMWPVLTNLVS